MSRITPMHPTVFVPSGTANRVIADLLERAKERLRYAQATLATHGFRFVAQDLNSSLDPEDRAQVLNREP